jgi:2-methylisocitrate lyase-like PEP mutase family enzyme
MHDVPRQKAKRLLRLHRDRRLLVLPNIWSPIGARVLERLGYPAVSTASAAISASLGYRDGERLLRSTVLDLVSRIASSVDVPVSADMESGYADTLADLDETIAGVIEAGVVGVNIEDGLEDGGPLRGIDEQCERIARVRRVASSFGLHLVINARVDCFLSSSFLDRSEALEEVVRRASAYVEAGADCVYPIGPGDAETVGSLRARISSPLNVLATPSAAPLSELEAMGVERVSFGPFIFRSLLRTFVDITTELGNRGGYTALSNMLTKAEAEAYLRDEPEPPAGDRLDTG